MSDTVVRMGRTKKTIDSPSPSDGAHSEGKGTTDTVRVRKELARRISVVATFRDVSVSDLLSPQIEDWVNELYEQFLRGELTKFGDKKSHS